MIPERKHWFSVLIVLFYMCALVFMTGVNNPSYAEDGTAQQPQTTGKDDQAHDVFSREMQQLETRIIRITKELEKESAELDKQIEAIEADLKRGGDKSSTTKLETKLMNAREIRRSLSFYTSLLLKEKSLRQSVTDLSGEIQNLSKQRSIDPPSDRKQAQEMVSKLTLLKSEAELVQGKIESLHAELDVKKVKLTGAKNIESDQLGPLGTRIAQLKKDILLQEIAVITLQTEEHKLKAESVHVKIDYLQKVVENIDPILLTSTEETLRRKERRTQRMQKKEDEQRDILVKERQFLEKKISIITRKIALKEDELSHTELSEEQISLIQVQLDLLLKEQEVLEQKQKLVNWRQEFSNTKIDLEEKRLDIEVLKLHATQHIEDQAKYRELDDRILVVRQELASQKMAFKSKAKVYQKEIEKEYIVLDYNADAIDELNAQLEKKSSKHVEQLIIERIKLEEMINEKIRIIERLRELMDQFNFQFDLQDMKWQEIEHLLPSSGKAWYALTILNSRITVLQLLQFFIGIVVTLVAAKALFFVTRTKLAKWFKNEQLTTIFERPLRFLLIVIGVYLSTKFLYFTGDLKILVSKMFDTLIILCISYMVVKIVDFLVSLLIPFVERTETKLDDQLIPIIRKAAKIFVIIICSVILIERLGYPVSSIIAGLGIGGLAFALAAKDTLANLFGSIVIFADRPFQIGDWVVISDSEGVVEEVGVRSTKIRTFADTLITIPNNLVANSTIKNISAFRNRRVYINVGITYDAGPEGALKSVEIIKAILDENPRVKDGHYIFFDDFKDSSLNLMVYYFVASTVWREYLAVREEVNAEMMRRFSDEGINFAFPTQTIEFNQPDLPIKPFNQE